MSAVQFEAQLGITYKTAWLLAQKLRRSMIDPEREPLEGVVEVGLASHHHPTSCWDIVGRGNPRKGAPTVRRAPRRRRTATGMRADGTRPPEKPQTPALALDRDQPGTTG
jgi:hypothetical protein